MPEGVAPSERHALNGENNTLFVARRCSEIHQRETEQTDAFPSLNDLVEHIIRQRCKHKYPLWCIWPDVILELL